MLPILNTLTSWTTFDIRCTSVSSIQYSIQTYCAQAVHGFRKLNAISKLPDKTIKASDRRYLRDEALKTEECSRCKSIPTITKHIMYDLRNVTYRFIPYTYDTPMTSKNAMIRSGKLPLKLSNKMKT